MKSVELIVARDTKFGIGLNGKIPWRCRDDMLHFKKVTSRTIDPEKQNAVIMGRRTWESLNKPLVDRINIVLSSSPQLVPSCQTLKAAIKYANKHPLVEKIFIIGGSQVYREAMETLDVNTVWMTIIHREFPTDRNVRFLRSHLSLYLNNSLIVETDEYSIWKYSR